MTEEKTFDEQFPELIDKWFRFDADDDETGEPANGTMMKCCGCDAPKFKNEDITFADEFKDNNTFFRDVDVQKHCISKQRVKELLEELEDISCSDAPNVCGCCETINDWRKEKLKELGI